MDLAHVILGAVVTEKAERLKTARTYTLTVDQNATKIDVKNALRRFFSVEVTSVRSLRVRPKARAIGAGRILTKRHRSKRMMVTLTPDSKAIDLTRFAAVSN